MSIGGSGVNITKIVGIPLRNAKPLRTRLKSLSRLGICSVSSRALEARDGVLGGTSPPIGETAPLKGPKTTTDQSVDQEETIARVETTPLRENERSHQHHRRRVR